MINDDNLDKYFFKIDVTQKDIDESIPSNCQKCAIGLALKREYKDKYNVNKYRIFVDNIYYFCDDWLTLWQHELIINKSKSEPITVVFDRQMGRAQTSPYKPKTFSGWLYKIFNIAKF